MEVMKMTSLWLLMMTTAAGSDSLLSHEGADLEGIKAVAKQQENRINQLEAALEGFNQKNNQQDSRVEQLEAELANLQQECTNANALPRNNPIAFTASLSERFSGSENDAVVPYDTVYLNHGEAYDTTDYHFKAPVRGIYWFTISLLAQHRVKLFMEVNGDRLFAAEDGNNFGGDAFSAILMLEAGDEVACVKPRNADDCHEDGEDLPRFNIFAGFLYAAL